MTKVVDVIDPSNISSQKPGEYDAQIEARIEELKDNFKDILWLSEQIKDREAGLQEGENLSLKEHIDAMALFAIMQEQKTNYSDMNREGKDGFLRDLMRDANTYIDNLPKGPQKSAERLPKETMSEAIADQTLVLILQVWSLNNLRDLDNNPANIKYYQDVELKGSGAMIERSILLARNFYIERWPLPDAAILKGIHWPRK